MQWLLHVSAGGRHSKRVFSHDLRKRARAMLHALDGADWLFQYEADTAVVEGMADRSLDDAGEATDVESEPEVTC